MPLEDEFVADALYDADALFLDEIVEVDRAADRVVARMTPHPNLPLTVSQRVRPDTHPRHVNGGLMIHITGVLGLAHGYYCLGLRSRDGWVGFGAGIHNARYPSIAVMESPLILVAEAIKVRQGATRVMARYRFTFTQDDRTVFASEQSAMWVRERARPQPAAPGTVAETPRPTAAP